MKFTCEKLQLVSAVSVASRTVAIKSSIPGLEGLHIRAGARLTLTGYNLETGITVCVDADISESGVAVFPARLFFDIIRKLPDDVVSVSMAEDYKVTVQCGISRFTFTAMSAEDYPELPDVDSKKGIRLPQQELKAMIAGTLFAASDSQIRPIHTGISFEVEKTLIRGIAVDGYRLAMRVYPLPEGENDRDFQFVVPSSGLRELEKILEDTEEECEFFLGPKHILYHVGDATLVCRILEGDFLDWRRVVPQVNPIRMVADVGELSRSIDRVNLVISEKMKSPMRCLFGNGIAYFQAASTIGTANDSCTIEGDGGELEIGFNCKFLLDALSAIPDEKCTLEFINGLSPLVMNPIDGSKRFSYMVLPVRLKAEE